MSNKVIVYTATDSGIDGREPTRVLYAAFTEAERDKSKPWRRKSEQIVDLDTAKAKALAKLDGVDRLVLGLPPWTEKF